ncbi:hypothetical protein GG681_09570 [Epibacterium sp. SM1969]|uniref:Uncharacterized protein n=1 Tax=Tritonibacter aquimaris TaxID=2663379 RepID=A0A844AY64_9RHOB|nr:hypothetical protein [Tritonibacter aquimaris]MQY42891.1 hypothetical protein [Tritonibacter aquimaris]
MTEEPLWTFEDGETFQAASNFHAMSKDVLTGPCAHRGDGGDAAHESIVDIHRMARVEYAKNIHKVGRNVYPLIIARDNAPEGDRADQGRQGLGGVFTLYLKGGETRTIQPTPAGYERLKCLSHIPLGLFNILSPHFLDPGARAWMGKTREMGAKISEAVRRLDDAAFDARETKAAATILRRSEGYVNRILEDQKVTAEGFEVYAASIRASIRDAMDYAAELQMDACMAALRTWRDELGADEWRKLHVVVTTIWPVSEHSPRWQLFRTLMDPETVDTHLIVGEGVKTTEEARDLLGRIVADRLASRLIVGIDDERGRRMTQCLSSRTDVVADSAYRALQRQCPMAGGVEQSDDKPAKVG